MLVALSFERVDTVGTFDSYGIIGPTGATAVLNPASDTQHLGAFSLSQGSFKIGGLQVVGARQTGWTAATGTPATL